MDLQGDINWIQSEIAKVRDPQLIMAFKSLLNYRNSRLESTVDEDWWDELPASEKAAIDEGLDQLNRGETFSSDSVRAEIKSRFNF